MNIHSSTFPRPVIRQSQSAGRLNPQVAAPPPKLNADTATLSSAAVENGIQSLSKRSRRKLVATVASAVGMGVGIAASIWGGANFSSGTNTLAAAALGVGITGTLVGALSTAYSASDGVTDIKSARELTYLRTSSTPP